MFHNEALQALEIAVAASVEELPRTSPPVSPAIGASYIVANSGTGAWATKDQSIACFTSGGWRFIAPFDGLTAFVKSEATVAVYRGGAWEFGAIRGSALLLEGQQVVGPRASGIASPTGGTTIDSEARAAVGQILSALRSHGLIET